jgi:NAD dependent epimerase/dehydratase family
LQKDIHSFAEGFILGHSGWYDQPAIRELKYFTSNRQIVFNSLLQILAQGRNRMKILVTGGAGFIGSPYADALIDRGDEVIVLTAIPRSVSFAPDM